MTILHDKCAAFEAEIESLKEELKHEKAFRIKLWVDYESQRAELDRCYSEIETLKLKLKCQKVVRNADTTVR